MCPNFIMCVSTICHKRKDCYRYRALPSEKQSYENFYENLTTGKPLCKDFIECIQGDKLSNT